MDPTDAVSLTIAVVGLLVSILSMAIAAGALTSSKNVHAEQQLLARRQLLLPLWDHLAHTDDIDPDRPIIPDVIKAVNTLELVALCWEGQLIDEALIRRTFAVRYRELYEAVDQCGRLKSGWKTGRELLNENPAACSLYRTLREEHEKRDAVGPI